MLSEMISRSSGSADASGPVCHAGAVRAALRTFANLRARRIVQSIVPEAVEWCGNETHPEPEWPITQPEFDSRGHAAGGCPPTPSRSTARRSGGIPSTFASMAMSFRSTSSRAPRAAAGRAQTCATLIRKLSKPYTQRTSRGSGAWAESRSSGRRKSCAGAISPAGARCRPTAKTTIATRRSSFASQIVDGGEFPPHALGYGISCTYPRPCK